MLSWAIAFFVVALVAALFGFGGIASSAMVIGKFVFVAFLVLAVITLVGGIVQGKKRLV